jgi:hypothetical protein
MVEYQKGLNNLSALKAIKACGSNSLTTAAESSLADHDKTPLTVWVDKANKRIVKLSSHSTTQDEKKGTTGTIELNFDYKKVAIQAPANAKPALDVLTELQTAAQSDPTLQLLLNSDDSFTNAAVDDSTLLVQ